MKLFLDSSWLLYNLMQPVHHIENIFHIHFLDCLLLLSILLSLENQYMNHHVQNLLYEPPHLKFTFLKYTLWRRGVVAVTTAQLHSTNPEFRFCTGSNICSRCVEDSRWWGSLIMTWLEIRLNAFRRSTIPQKQFIMIISILNT